MSWLEYVRWNADGLAPAVAQEATTGKVLTLAWMNRESLAHTEATGEAHYWSRSRAKLWHKGETSGHVQLIREVRLDCDRDAILLVVEQMGGIACHTGREHCFYRRLEDGAWRDVDPVIRDPESIYAPRGADDSDVLHRVAAAIESRRGADPAGSYVASLLAKGDDAILKKIGEEATETVMAGKDGAKDRIVSEIADLWFHCLVLLARHGLHPADVLAELARREGVSGHAEKASRR